MSVVPFPPLKILNDKRTKQYKCFVYVYRFQSDQFALHICGGGIF